MKYTGIGLKPHCLVKQDGAELRNLYFNFQVVLMLTASRTTLGL